MNILIMGGTQFVSSSLAKYLIEKGYKVDIFTRGINALNYKGYSNHLKGNRKDVNDLTNLLKDKKYEYIYDISAYTKDDLELLVKVINRENLKNYIFCSSGAVYEESDEILNEESKRGFNKNWGDYGLFKKEAEDFLFKINKEENFPMTIFRPTYIYGDGNNLYRESYIFERILNNKDIPIPKSEKKNQFIYIDDLLKTFESAMYTNNSIGKAYNLTNIEELTWRELCEKAMDIVGKKVNLKEIDYIEKNLEVRSFFPFRDVTFLLEIDKLIKDGLYEPKIAIREGLEKTFKWYLDEKPILKDKRMIEVESSLKGE